MGLKNPFRRNKARAEGELLHGVHNPWWAWGPLGFFWFGGHANDTNIDAGSGMHHTGDAGHFHNPTDPGAGMGGFDGGGGGGF